MSNTGFVGDATGAWSDFGTKAELLITNLFAVKHGSGRRFYVSGHYGTYCGQVAAGSLLMIGCPIVTGTICRRYGLLTALWQE